MVAVPVLRGGFVAERNLAPVDVPARRHRARRHAHPRRRRGRASCRVGAAVDVLASFDARSSASDDTSATVVIAAGVLVLRTDTRASGGTGRADALGVTLLDGRDEAERLADAQANGVLTLALVPPEEAAVQRIGRDTQ
jgi:hypothetical protein